MAAANNISVRLNIIYKEGGSDNFIWSPGIRLCPQAKNFIARKKYKFSGLAN